MREPSDRPAPRPTIRIVRGEGCGYSSASRTRPEHQDHHRDREWRILRVHEHVAVEDRAERQQQQRCETRERAADPAAEPPRHRKPDDADDGAEQAARLEQFERNDLVQQGRDHVEAAAIHVEVGERQRAGVLETGTEHVQQQVGIFGVGIIVPAEPVVAEGQASDNGDRSQHQHGEIVANLFNRAPRRRVDGRSRDG